MKHKLLKSSFVAATLFAAAGMAFAAVVFNPDFDPDTELLGYVGKGDIQTLFGWNNKQLQNNAAGITFTYEEVGSYTLVCSRLHPQQGYQEQTFPNKVSGIEADVDYELKKVQQVSGFLLIEFKGDPIVSGDGCPAAWPNEVSRTLNEGAGSPAGLYVHHNGISHYLWP